MPTVQATDDFDHAIDATYYTDGFFGSPAAVTSPLYQSQPKSLRCTSPASGVEGVRENLTGSPAIAWAAFPLYVETLANEHPVFNFWSAGFAEAAYLSVDPGGLFLTLGADIGLKTAINAGQWYWVELIYDVSANPHTLYGRVGTTDLDSVSTAVAATTVDNSQLVVQFTPSGDDFFYGLWKYGTASGPTDWLGEPSEIIGRKRIIGPRHLGTVAETLYAVPSGRRMTLQHIWLSNPTAAPVDVSLSIGTDVAGTRILDGHRVPAGGRYAIRSGSVNTLEAGEVIQGFADTGSAVVLVVDAYEEKVG